MNPIKFIDLSEPLKLTMPDGGIAIQPKCAFLDTRNDWFLTTPDGDQVFEDWDDVTEELALEVVPKGFFDTLRIEYTSDKK